VPEELKPVAEKINEMLSRLEEGFARERRFTSHAAHELRTPLAELKVMVDLIEQWPDEFNREHAREMLRVVAESEALLQALSLLSRAEAGGEMAVAETFSLGPSVQELIDKTQEIAGERRVTFQTCVEGESISTVLVLWRSILQNLLSNAASYAREGTVVEVEASPCHLSVSNDVDNLTSEDIPHLTERFWRKSESRSDRTHSGLGLSIVSACAAQLGAKCRTTLDGSRLRISVEW
jgi:signal transduction histidine kinase